MIKPRIYRVYDSHTRHWVWQLHVPAATHWAEAIFGDFESHAQAISFAQSYLTTVRNFDQGVAFIDGVLHPMEATA